MPRYEVSYRYRYPHVTTTCDAEGYTENHIDWWEPWKIRYRSIYKEDIYCDMTYYDIEKYLRDEVLFSDTADIEILHVDRILDEYEKERIAEDEDYRRMLRREELKERVERDKFNSNPYLVAQRDRLVEQAYGRFEEDSTPKGKKDAKIENRNYNEVKEIDQGSPKQKSRRSALKKWFIASLIISITSTYLFSLEPTGFFVVFGIVFAIGLIDNLKKPKAKTKPLSKGQSEKKKFPTSVLVKLLIVSLAVSFVATIVVGLDLFGFLIVGVAFYAILIREGLKRYRF